MAGAKATDHRTGVLLLVFGAAVISFSPVFVRVADVDPTVAGFYRNLFGGICLLVVGVWRGDALWRGWRPLALAAAAALLFALDLTFWHRSILYVGPGLATILGNFQIFFLGAFGIVVFRERLDWRYGLSVPLALAGLGLLVGVDWSASGRQHHVGVTLGLLTAFTYAAYVLVLQRSQTTARRLPATTNLALVSLLSASCLGVEGWLLEESFAIPDTRGWLAMLAYGTLCQALGWAVISRGLTLVAASRAGLILLLQPTLAFIWDVLLFARPTDAPDVGGAVLALAAIYLGTARDARRT